MQIEGVQRYNWRAWSVLAFPEGPNRQKEMQYKLEVYCSAFVRGQWWLGASDFLSIWKDLGDRNLPRCANWVHCKRRGSEKSTFLAIFWGVWLFWWATVVFCHWNTTLKSTCLYTVPCSHTFKTCPKLVSPWGSSRTLQRLTLQHGEACDQKKCTPFTRCPLGSLAMFAGVPVGDGDCPQHRWSGVGFTSPILEGSPVYSADQFLRAIFWETPYSCVANPSRGGGGIWAENAWGGEGWGGRKRIYKQYESGQSTGLPLTCLCNPLSLWLVNESCSRFGKARFFHFWLSMKGMTSPQKWVPNSRALRTKCEYYHSSFHLSITTQDSQQTIASCATVSADCYRKSQTTKNRRSTSMNRKRSSQSMTGLKMLPNSGALSS